MTHRIQKKLAIFAPFKIKPINKTTRRWKMENRKDKTAILFVCLGNICRSPAAEGIMKQLIEDQGLSDKYYVDSAGMGNWHEGQLPDARMRQHGAKRGYDFCSRARQFKADDFGVFDYIVVMDEQNYSDARSLALTDEEAQKVVRMADYLRQFEHHDHIPDPYYGGASGFDLVLDLLEDGC